MAAAVPILLAATVAVGGAQVVESRKARKSVEKESRRQEEEQLKIEDELKDDEQKEEKETADLGKRTQRSVKRAQKPRRRETILTSPLGLIDEPETARKTLLGR